MVRFVEWDVGARMISQGRILSDKIHWLSSFVEVGTERTHCRILARFTDFQQTGELIYIFVLYC